MKASFGNDIFGVLAILMFLMSSATLEVPRIQVISHNLAGAFCKIRNGKTSDDPVMKISKVMQLMQSYEKLVDRSTTDLVIFHFQEVCEAKFDIKRILEMPQDKINTHVTMHFALREVFKDWRCDQLVYLLNFGTYACYNDQKIRLNLDMTQPLINLKNDWASRFLPTKVDNIKRLIKELSTEEDPKSKKDFTWEFSADKLQATDVREELNIFQEFFLTKGSVTVPIVAEIVDNASPTSERIKLWIVSSNVHLSSKDIKERQNHFGNLYNEISYLEAYLRGEAKKDEASKHVFFSFIAGDFNSRSVKIEKDKIKLLNFANDSISNNPSSSQVSEDWAKNLAICLLFHKKIGQSNYDTSQIGLLNETNQRSAQSHYYQKCKPIFKTFLKNNEEFKAENLEFFRSKISSDENFPKIVEPALNGLNIPTFVFDVYTQLNNLSIDYLQGTYDDLAKLIAETADAAATKKRSAHDLYAFKPTNIPSPTSFGENLDSYYDQIPKPRVNQQPRDSTKWRIVPDLKEIKNSLIKKAGNQKSRAEGYVSIDNIKEDLDDSKSISFEVQPWEFLDIEYQLTPSDHETPSWCDRLMYLSNPKNNKPITIHRYQAHFDIRFSDHVPISFVADLENIEVKSVLQNDLFDGPVDIDSIDLNLDFGEDDNLEKDLINQKAPSQNSETEIERSGIIPRQKKNLLEDSHYPEIALIPEPNSPNNLDFSIEPPKNYLSLTFTLQDMANFLAGYSPVNLLNLI